MADDIFADGWGPDEDPFEEDRDLVPHYEGDEEYKNLLREIGAYDLDDITVDENEASASGQRGQRFETPEEAAQWLYDAGILAFSRIVRYRYEDDHGNIYDAFGVDVSDTSGKKKG